MSNLLEELRTDGEVYYSGYIFVDQEKLRMVFVYSASDMQFHPANFVGTIFFEREQYWYKKDDAMIHLSANKDEAIINWVKKRGELL